MGNLFSSDEETNSTLSNTRQSSLQNGIPSEAALLRLEACQLRLEAKTASTQSQHEYKFGCRAQAKLLSIKKNELYKQVDKINQQAAQLIFRHFNQNRSKNVIDLHGLYATEALKYLQDKLNTCRLEKMPELTVITGIGNNSPNNIAKIKPEVENFVRRNQLNVTCYGGHIVIDLTTNKPTNDQNSYECIIL